MKSNVSEASAEIMGAPDLHIRCGSQLKIVCSIRHSTEPPSYVFWYHEDHMINHDPGVHVIYGRTSSSLVLQNADSGHSGNYTCYPSNAVPAYVNVHVLNATEGQFTFRLTFNCTPQTLQQWTNNVEENTAHDTTHDIGKVRGHVTVLDRLDLLAGI